MFDTPIIKLNLCVLDFRELLCVPRTCVWQLNLNFGLLFLEFLSCAVLLLFCVAIQSLQLLDCVEDHIPVPIQIANGILLITRRTLQVESAQNFYAIKLLDGLDTLYEIAPRLQILQANQLSKFQLGDLIVGNIQKCQFLHDL